MTSTVHPFSKFVRLVTAVEQSTALTRIDKSDSLVEDRSQKRTFDGVMVEGMSSESLRMINFYQDA